MDKSLLRKAAIQSLALMLSVIAFSYATSQYKTVTIKAVGNSAIQIADKKLASSGDKTIIVSSSKTEVPSAKLRALQERLPDSDMSVLKKLGDNFFMIKKPQGSNLSLKLNDLYINKSIQLTITGITMDDMTSDMISRVKADKIYKGDPKYTEKITEKKITEKEKKKGKSKEKVMTKVYGDDPCQGIILSASQDTQSKQFTAKILLKLDRVYAYITYEDEQYYYIDLRKPSEVYDKILVVDAGHGGKDCGALSRDNRYYEKKLNLDILLDLKKLLDKEKIKVYYTRTGDDTVYLRPREELANEVDCDYFISIHCNASNVSYPNGTEVLYYNKKPKGVKNSKLAKLFSKQLDKASDITNKGIVKKYRKDIFIMNKAIVPMVLIEVGYLTNNKDINYLRKPDNRKKIAKGIYEGIMKAYKELPVDKK